MKFPSIEVSPTLEYWQPYSEMSGKTSYIKGIPILDFQGLRNTFTPEMSFTPRFEEIYLHTGSLFLNYWGKIFEICWVNGHLIQYFT